MHDFILLDFVGTFTVKNDFFLRQLNHVPGQKGKQSTNLVYNERKKNENKSGGGV
jgi:hypothetical protein